jgi:hypothetical protein
MKFSLRCSAVAVCCVVQTAIAQPQPAAAPAPMLLPGSRAIDVKRLASQTQSMRVLVRAGSGDTTEREWSRVTRSDQLVESPAGQIVHTFAYAPPRTVRDSLVVQQAGMAPVFERLDLGTSQITLRYEGNRVLGTVQRGDSVQPFERNFSHDVFAFNQLESLVRSLDYKAGMSTVVPLFSEQDLKLEYDTLAVVGKENSNGRDVWRVRFSDAVIVSDYLVDAATRRVLAQETRQRASGARFRYEVVGAL